MGPHFQGGPLRDFAKMAEASAALRDQGGLPADASLVLTQLLLNLAGHAGRARAEGMISNFLDAADVGRERGAGELLLVRFGGIEPGPAGDVAKMHVLVNSPEDLEIAGKSVLETMLRFPRFDRVTGEIAALLRAIGDEAVAAVTVRDRGGQMRRGDG